MGFRRHAALFLRQLVAVCSVVVKEYMVECESQRLQCLLPYSWL